MRTLFIRLLMVTSFTLVLCENARSECSSHTNIGGWYIVLQSPTAYYSTQSNVVVSLIVSNTTSKTGELGRYSVISGAETTLTPFGELIVRHDDGKTNQVRQYHFESPSVRLPSGDVPVISGGENDGQVLPFEAVVFHFNLTQNWSVREPGRYTVYFRGKLSPPSNHGAEMGFSTTPLALMIDAYKTQTNSPPLIPNR